MNFFDILAFVLLGIAILVCAFKGFLKIFLKFGAFVIAVLLSKTFGRSVGSMIIPSSFDITGGRVSYADAEAINSTLASLLGTVLLFIVSYIFLRLIFAVIRRILKKGLNLGVPDKIIGACFGVLVGGAIVYALFEAIGLVATVVTIISPSSSFFETFRESCMYGILEFLTV